MTISQEELRALLGSDEPDYEEIARRLDPSAADHLRALAQDDNVMLATKAVYAASLVPAAEAQAVVERASHSGEPLLRIAAASALPNLPEAARNDIAERLLEAGDASVDKLVIRSLGGSLTPTLRQKLSRLGDGSDLDIIRQLSQEKLDEAE